MEYTELETLKEYLGINWNESNAILSKLITRTTQQFDKYIWRNLWSKTYIEYFSLDFDDFVIVNNWPIKSVTEMRKENETWEIVSFKRIDGNIIFLNEMESMTLYVKYVAGYTSLSEIGDVEQSCLEVCKDLWENTPSSGSEANIKSKQIETLSKTYFSRNEMAWGFGVNFRETLDNYKIFNPLIV